MATCLFRTGGYSAQIAERQLNDAIVNADIGRSYEEYLDIVDRFYAADVVMTSETTTPSVRGREALRSVVAFVLIPLHIMAEIGRMRALVRVQSMPSDNPNETHAAWTVDLVGVTGKTARSSGVVIGDGKDFALWKNTTATNSNSGSR